VFTDIAECDCAKPREAITIPEIFNQFGAYGPSLPDSYVTMVWRTQSAPYVEVDVHFTNSPQTSIVSEPEQAIEPALHSSSNAVVTKPELDAVDPVLDMCNKEHEDTTGGEYPSALLRGSVH
jgi:hypothetical protein